MKCLYIGQCEEGSTSNMRFVILKELLNCEIESINLTPIIINSPKIFRSIGWRYKIGPMMSEINTQIIKTIGDDYDMIWIDKGVFIKPQILKIIRNRTKKLIHFTPDPAFFYHKSRYFRISLPLYDFCITTKSFELDEYVRNGCKNLIYCTQGYDEIIHRSQNTFEEKEFDVCFIGHYEKQRAEIIQAIIDDGIKIVIAGINWESFIKKNKDKKNLVFFGSNVAGFEYSRLLSLSKVGLGLLSKWIPEKHTTRTFEIPACGTYLASEKNEEILSFFGEEVLYFQNSNDLLLKINQLLKDPGLLQIKMSNQTKILKNLEVSHQKIMLNLLNKVGIC
jgi:spore maturation protein CgeB